MILKKINGQLQEVGVCLEGSGGGQLPHLIVTSDAGSTVTASNGGSSVSMEETSEGIFEVDLPTWDEYTVTSILNEESVSSTITPNANFHMILYHFTATVEVTFPGTSCELLKSDQDTQYATTSPHTFTVHEAGEYEISVTHRGVIRTQLVTFTTSGQEEEVSFIPVGATVTPINDVATWLDCAALWDKNYTTLGDVIGDSEALLGLISNNNAVDYMARSYEFASYTGIGNNLVPYPYSDTTKTENSITWTDNGDGSVKATGTASAVTIFECQNSSGAFNLSAGTYTVTSGLGIIPSGVSLLVTGSDGTTTKFAELTSNEPRKTFTLSRTTAIRVRLRVAGSTALGSTGIIFRPMIRVASDLTLDPLSMLYIGQYNYAANSLLERNRNLNSYPYWGYIYNSSTAGITFTVNSDGSITVSGTASQETSFGLHFRQLDGYINPCKLLNGNYILSGCPSGGSEATYSMYATTTSPGSVGQTMYGYDTGDGLAFTVNGSYYSNEYTYVALYILIKQGTVISTPITFKPMIRLVTDTDDTWEPYRPWLRAISESEHYELVLNFRNPIMTSNTTPSGTAFASSTPGSSYDAYKAFDRNDVSGWLPASQATNNYVGYSFGQTTNIILAKIKARSNVGDNNAHTFIVQGSNDNFSSDVHDLNSFVLPHGVYATEYMFIDGNYSEYRVFCSDALYREQYFGIYIQDIELCGRTDITPPASRILKTFATASNEEILEMVCKADRGEIDLYEDAGWVVGQEHSVSIDPIGSTGINYTVGETQPAQIITFVLMHKGLYELVNPVKNTDGTSRNTCSFIAGMKDCLSTKGYMISSTGSNLWDSCARRAWCNYGFRNAISPYFRAAFKQFKTIGGTYNNTSTGAANTISNDFFALAAEKEVVNLKNNATDNEANALTQFTWYETTANRIKGIDGSSTNWWDRSSSYYSPSQFGFIGTTGVSTAGTGTSPGGISPFGCL